MALADSINPAYPLLHLHWVPWQIKVYKKVGGLEVQPLRRGVSTQQNINFSPKETPLYIFPVGVFEAVAFGIEKGAILSAEDTYPHFRVSLMKMISNIVEGIEIPGKKNCLTYSPVAAACLQPFQQLLDFRRRIVQRLECLNEFRKFAPFPLQVFRRAVLKHTIQEIILFVPFFRIEALFLRRQSHTLERGLNFFSSTNKGPQQGKK